MEARQRVLGIEVCVVCLFFAWVHPRRSHKARGEVVRNLLKLSKKLSAPHLEQLEEILRRLLEQGLRSPSQPPARETPRSAAAAAAAEFDRFLPQPTGSPAGGAGPSAGGGAILAELRGASSDLPLGWGAVCGCLKVLELGAQCVDGLVDLLFASDALLEPSAADDLSDCACRARPTHFERDAIMGVYLRRVSLHAKALSFSALCDLQESLSRQLRSFVQQTFSDSEDEASDSDAAAAAPAPEAPPASTPERDLGALHGRIAKGFYCGDPQTGVERATRALKAFPKSQVALSTLCWSLCRLRECRQSREALHRLLDALRQRAPPEGDALLRRSEQWCATQLATLHLHLGQRKSALAHLSEALLAAQSAGDARSAALCLSWLSELQAGAPGADEAADFACRMCADAQLPHAAAANALRFLSRVQRNLDRGLLRRLQRVRVGAQGPLGGASEMESDVQRRRLRVEALLSFRSGCKALCRAAALAHSRTLSSEASEETLAHGACAAAAAAGDLRAARGVLDAAEGALEGAGDVMLHVQSLCQRAQSLCAAALRPEELLREAAALSALLLGAGRALEVATCHGGAAEARAALLLARSALLSAVGADGEAMAILPGGSAAAELRQSALCGASGSASDAEGVALLLPAIHAKGLKDSAEALLLLAQAAYGEGRLERCEGVLKHALPYLRMAGDAAAEGRAWLLRAKAAARGGDKRRCHELARVALAIFEGGGLRAEALRAMHLVACSAEDAQQREDAARRLLDAQAVLAC